MVDDLKIMLTVICTNYLGKSEKNIICIIIWNTVYFCQFQLILQTVELREGGVGVECVLA